MNIRNCGKLDKSLTRVKNLQTYFKVTQMLLTSLNFYDVKITYSSLIIFTSNKKYKINMFRVNDVLYSCVKVTL